MEVKIKNEILRAFNKEEQIEKKYVLELVSVKCDCTQKEVQKMITALKKEKIIYSVRGLPGFIGINYFNLI